MAGFLLAVTVALFCGAGGSQALGSARSAAVFDRSAKITVASSTASLHLQKEQLENQQSYQDLEAVVVATNDAAATLRTVASSPYNTTILGLYDPIRTERQDPSDYKLLYLLNFVRQQEDPNKMLIFIDANDTLLQGGSPIGCPNKFVLIQHYLSANADIVLASELPEGQVAGGLMAPVWALSAILEDMFPSNFNSPDSDFGGFQGFWSQLYAQQEAELKLQDQDSFPIVPLMGVDTEHLIFSSLLAVQSSHDLLSMGMPGNHSLHMKHAEQQLQQPKLGCVLLSTGSSSTEASIYNVFRSYFVYAGSSELHNQVQQ